MVYRSRGARHTCYKRDAGFEFDAKPGWDCGIDSLVGEDTSFFSEGERGHEYLVDSMLDCSIH